MVKVNKETLKKEVFTIPNILSMIRILLIIATVVVFFIDFEYRYLIAGIILIVSGMTDVLDGIIARKFNMTSNLGKALDPFADKLTQFAVLICLISINLWILIPFAILVLRDCFMLITGISIFKRTHETFSALWYGKIATAYTYCLMCAMLVFKSFFDENFVFLIVLIGIDAALILLSFIMYAQRNISALHKLEKEENVNISNK